MKLFLLLSLIAFCLADDEPASKLPGKAEEIVERLAVNMAGALVKSVFPEMDRPEGGKDQPQQKPAANSEIRRAPVNPLNADFGEYSPSQAASEYNAIPQMAQMHENPRNPFQYQSMQPSQYSITSQKSSQGPDLGMIGSELPSLLSNGPGTPEALNAVRNQAYLADLSKHQAELNNYSAKQMEYLDQQRRYQQAMIDHQAGAALLMQKQQQDVINEQMKALKSGYNLDSEASPRDNTGGHILTAKARGVKTQKSPRKSFSEDDMVTNDDHLKEYFKERYGIDIPEDVSELSEDERATLRELKKQLLKQKEKAIDNGAFNTMDNLRARVKTVRSSPKSQNTALNADACQQCLPLSYKTLRGAWTQIYGNPKVVNKIFGTVMTLENMDSSTSNIKMTSKKVSCVGMEVGKERKKISRANIFFRENNSRNELHEMKGTLAIRDDVLLLDTNLYRTQMCLVKAGPSDSDRYEYIVLSETTGPNACRSYHVFARNTDEFNRRHFDDVSEFMKDAVTTQNVLPLGVIPSSALCELSHE